jgi:hypothetical protein
MSPTTRISSDPVSPKSKVGRSATKERCSKQHHVPGPFQDDNTNNYCSEGRTADTASRMTTPTITVRKEGQQTLLP